MSEPTQRGFTLIEMLVSISIFTIVTIVVLLRFNTFTYSVVVTGEAYGIALNMRQAQTYGINVRGSASDEFTKPYGVYLNIGGGGSDRLYTLFQDQNAEYNGETDVITVQGFNGNELGNCGISPNGECVEKRVTRNQTRIYEICTKQFGAGNFNCNASRLNVMFVRPSPKAILFGNDPTTKFEEAQIVVAADDPTKGRARITVVWTGEISVTYEKD